MNENTKWFPLKQFHVRHSRFYLTSGRFRGFSRQNNWISRDFANASHVALRTRNSDAESGGELFKGSKDAASLLVCTRKKLFGLGVQIFCEWRRKWRAFRPHWPTSPGPGLKPLDGSIWLKLLLEFQPQSESFVILNDLLGFRVQKFWSKVIKMFD